VVQAMMCTSRHGLCGLVLICLCFCGCFGTFMVTQTPSTVKVKEGESVDITCCWNNNIPWPKVKWFKDKRAIHVNSTGKIHLTETRTPNCSVLTITNTYKNDTGIYICEVTQDIPQLCHVNGTGTNLTYQEDKGIKNTLNTEEEERHLEERDEPTGHERELEERDEPTGHERDLEERDEPTGHERDLEERDEPTGHERDLEERDEPTGQETQLEERDELTGQETQLEERDEPGHERQLEERDEPIGQERQLKERDELTGHERELEERDEKRMRAEQKGWRRSGEHGSQTWGTPGGDDEDVNVTIMPVSTTEATTTVLDSNTMLLGSVSSVMGLICICACLTAWKLSRKGQRAERIVIREGPPSEEEEPNISEEEQSSRGSTHWCMVPVYESYFDLQRNDDQESAVENTGSDTSEKTGSA
ncbi:hypothetical protein P4O66_008783, partial [Electrophorus voltai]